MNPSLHSAQERVYSFLLEKAGCFVVLIDKERRIIDVNRVAPGFTREDVIGTPAKYFVAPEHAALFDKQIVEVIEEGKVVDTEVMAPAAYGMTTVYHASAGPLYDDAGEIIGAIVHAADIAPHENVKPDMRARNQFMRSILEHMPVVLFCLNADGIYTESTGLGLHRRGLQDRELLGKKAAELYPNAANHIEQALVGGSCMYEVTGEHDGQLWTYLVHLFFDADRGEGAIGFSIDITEQTVMQQQSQETIRDLKAKLAATQLEVDHLKEKLAQNVKQAKIKQSL